MAEGPDRPSVPRTDAIEVPLVPAGALDTHAHVFRHGLAHVEGRRYAPDYEARLVDYLGLLDAHGIAHGVLVQPSFLGTDNDFLAACLREAAGRLRGTAVLASDAPDEAFAALGDVGVTGLRYNLISGPVRPPLDRGTLRLAERAAARGWHIDVHAEGRVLADALATLLPIGGTLLVDHFGRPGNGAADCPGFAALLAASDSGRVWVKLSGPYRFARNADEAARRLLAAFGPQRLMWASDWPWTQFETRMRFEQCLAWLADWVPDPAQRSIVLVDTPARVFGFPAPS